MFFMFDAVWLPKHFQLQRIRLSHHQPQIQTVREAKGQETVSIAPSSAAFSCFSKQ
jgi:hypothetical protein